MKRIIYYILVAVLMCTAFFCGSASAEKYFSSPTCRKTDQVSFNENNLKTSLAIKNGEGKVSVGQARYLCQAFLIKFFHTSAYASLYSAGSVNSHKRFPSSAIMKDSSPIYITNKQLRN